MVTYEDMFEAYYDCLKNKRKSAGAVKYFQGFEEDLIRLTDEVNTHHYEPGISTAFIVKEPVRREIFAACFRDRIIHHYMIMRLEPLFERFFTERTFNCRKEKGVLYGLNTLREDLRICSRDYTTDCWIMKLDLKGFFMSIDKRLLNESLQDFVWWNYSGEDKDYILYLIDTVVMHEPEKHCVRRSDDSEWEALSRDKSLFHLWGGTGASDWESFKPALCQFPVALA